MENAALIPVSGTCSEVLSYQTHDRPTAEDTLLLECSIKSDYLESLAPPSCDGTADWTRPSSAYALRHIGSDEPLDITTELFVLILRLSVSRPLNKLDSYRTH